MYIAIADIKPLGKEGLELDLPGNSWGGSFGFTSKMLDKTKARKVNIEEIAAIVQQMKPKIVRINGGEPTEQDRELKALVSFLKQLGVAVQLESNGSRPGVIGDLLVRNLIDWFTLEVRSPLEDENLFKKMTGGKGDPQKVRETIDLAHDNAKFFEVVYTVVPGLNDKLEQVQTIAKEVLYCNSFVLRGFDHSKGIADKNFEKYPQPNLEMLKPLGEKVRDTLVSVDSVKLESIFGQATI